MKDLLRSSQVHLKYVLGDRKGKVLCFSTTKLRCVPFLNKDINSVFVTWYAVRLLFVYSSHANCLLFSSQSAHSQARWEAYGFVAPNNKEMLKLLYF